MTRDMTQAQFRAACKRRAFRPEGVLGYYALGETGAYASVFNAGPSRREQLAHLIREHERAVGRHDQRKTP